MGFTIHLNVHIEVFSMSYNFGHSLSYNIVVDVLKYKW
jgi:hypothetical protein